MNTFDSVESSDMESSISLSGVSESFSFEKPSEKEKTQKFCRCIYCFSIPLIYFKYKTVYLKCINCPDVYTPRHFFHYIYRDLVTYKYLLRKENIDNIYFENGEFYEEEKGKKKLPIYCIDSYCEKHFLKYYYFCETCQSNLCLDCKNYHNGHIIKYLNDYKLTSNEIEEIEKILFETNEYFSNKEDIVKRIKQNLEDNLIKGLDYLETHKNDLNNELINDLINKIPNNINDIANFPNDFNNYILNLINKVIENNLTNSNYKSNLIEELQNEMISKVELFKKEISNIENDIHDYILDNQFFVLFAQNIIDIYKLKENNINYQIIINLVNLRDSLQNISNNKMIINEFEEFQYFINCFFHPKHLLKDYKGIEKVFSEKILNLNIFNIVENNNYTSDIQKVSLLTNLSVRELTIINWIKNKVIFNEQLLVFHRN